MTAAANAIAILRIELEDIEPLIWRRVAVRASMNLETVHGVIQATMGWLDNHLWEFTANERKYGIPIPNEPEWNARIINAATTTLSTLVTHGTDIGYTYDIGDNWQHRIIVEKLKPAEPETPYPQFLGGERRCPPEDCGGCPGYYEFLTISPTSGARSARPHSTGMAAPTTRTTSTSSRSSAISVVLRAVAAETDEKPLPCHEVVLFEMLGDPSFLYANSYVIRKKSAL